MASSDIAEGVDSLAQGLDALSVLADVASAAYVQYAATTDYDTYNETVAAAQAGTTSLFQTTPAVTTTSPTYTVTSTSQPWNDTTSRTIVSYAVSGSSSSSSTTIFSSVPASTDAVYSTPLSSTALISISVVGTLVSIGLILAAVLCTRRVRRRRRLASSVPHTRQVDRHRNGPQVGNLTTAEVAQILPFPQRMAGRSGQASYPFTNRDLYAGGDRRESSAWTDDSEFDMMAVDGSSLARTLSSTSTRRQSFTSDATVRSENPFSHPGYTLPPRAPPRLVTDLKSPNASSTMSPFGGVSPAGWPNTGSGSSSRSPGSSTPSNTYDTYSSTSRPLLTPLSSTYDRTAPNNPFLDPPAISPISPFNTNSSRTYPVNTYQRGYPHQPLSDVAPSPISERSWSSADDSRFIHTLPMSERGASGLSRGLTIIQHADGGRASPTSEPSAVRRERSGREADGVEVLDARGRVHLPPTYGELYGA